MLIPVQRDLALYPGATFNPLFVFYSDQGHTQPFALAGYSAQMSIGNGLLILTSISGLTLGASDGTVQALASPSQTAAVPPGEYAWWLQWTSPGGEVDEPAFGVITAGQPVPAR